MPQNQEQPAGFFVATPDLEPPTEQDAGKRAIYFAQLIRIACRDFLRKHLSQCAEGGYGKDLEKAAQSCPSHSFSNAVKELTCVSIYITALDQGGLEKVDRWLLNLLQMSAQVTDRLIEGSPSHEILQMHEFVADYDICQECALSVCRTIGFKQSVEAAYLPVKEYLLQSGQLRGEILQMALTLPIDAVTKQLLALK